MKSKRAQTGVAIALIVLVLVIVAIIIIAGILLSTNVIRISGNSVSSSQNQASQSSQSSQTQENQVTTCPSPYIQVGSVCCLDQNINRICDKDEPSQEQTTCLRPYINSGNTCCLDEDNNKLCDKDEGTREDRIRASLDSPFDITDIDIDRDEIDIQIENEENNYVTIKTIDIEDCDRIHPDKRIDAGDEKSFLLEDCDFPSRINSDIEVEYTIGNSTDVHTSDGRIREELQDYYNDY